MIAIIDSGGANIASIQFALSRLGRSSKLTRDSNEIEKASHVILPGVGSASAAMKQLTVSKLDTVIKDLTQPVLGICLGMQLLFSYSQEGKIECLNIIKGDIEKISANDNLAIPHVGWNKLIHYKDNSLLKNVPNESYVYFVHSYIAPVTSNAIATTNYGQMFAAMVQLNNFYGVQFHPERSGEVGSIILKNFLEL